MADKRLVDTYLAVAVNMSLVCIFLATMISKLVEDLQKLGLPKAARRMFGFDSAYAPTVILITINMLGAS